MRDVAGRLCLLGYCFLGGCNFLVTTVGPPGTSPGSTVDTPVVKANQAPVLVAESLILDEDTPFQFVPQGTDADGDPLSYSVVQYPAHGILVPNGSGGFTYAPNANYSGSDSFSFKASDGHADSAITSVNISVSPMNDAPVATGQSVEVTSDIAHTLTLGASDMDNDALTYSVIAGPSHGALGTITGNTVTYTPATSYAGEDSFTFKANDGMADSKTVMVSISVVSYLYYYNSVISTRAWTTAGNWYRDLAHTQAAGRAPQNGDHVIICPDTVNLYDPQVALPLLKLRGYEGAGPSGGSSPSFHLGQVTRGLSIAAGGTLSCTGGYWGGTTEANVASAFTGNCINDGTLSGDATFSDTSSNAGQVNGNATFNDSAMNETIGTIAGTGTFNGSSTNLGVAHAEAVRSAGRFAILSQQNRRWSVETPGFTSVVLASPIPAGTLVVVRQNGALTSISSMTDSKSNTWANLANAFWYTIVTNGLVAGDTINLNAPANADGLLYVTLYSDVTSLRSSHIQNGSVPTATSCHAGDLAIGFSTKGETAAPLGIVSGWTRNYYKLGFAAGNGTRSESFDSKIVGSAGDVSYPNATTGGGNWNWLGAICFGTTASQ